MFSVSRPFIIDSESDIIIYKSWLSVMFFSFSIFSRGVWFREVYTGEQFVSF